MSELKQQTEQKMLKSLESLKNELGKIRTGRAQPSILDHVMVEYYGSMVPLNQVANVTLIDARTVRVQPWEKPMGAKIPAASGTETRLYPPAHQRFCFILE